MAVNTRMEHLQRVPLFAGLNKRELRSVAAVCSIVRRPAGYCMVAEGSNTDVLFIIVEGTVDVVRKGRRVAHFGPGEFFGEIALLDPGPRTASVVTATDVVVIELTRKSLMQVVGSDPQIPVRIMEALARRLRATTAKISN
ncbi:MAG TPA: cyclic nucleotide-binding domain-containing protein [Ilumatobacteraceae bacterium]